MKKNLFYFLAIALSIVLVSCEKPGDSTKPGGGSNSHAGGACGADQTEKAAVTPVKKTVIVTEPKEITDKESTFFSR